MKRIMSPEIISGLVGATATLLGVFLTQWLTSRRARISDKKQMEKWRVIFDQAAFKGLYEWKSEPDAFVQTLRQVTKAINTGQVVLSRGNHIDSMSGLAKSQLRDHELRSIMDDVAGQLHSMRVLIETTPREALMTLEDPLDTQRDRMIKTLNRALGRVKLEKLKLPTEYENPAQVGPDAEFT
jgi:hypothetical protein